MEKPSKKNIALIVFGLIILICAIIVYFIGPQDGADNESDISKKIERQTETSTVPIEGDFWFGSEKPKITIVEFSDFECPYCKESHSKIRQIGIKYKDSVKIVFKDYPVHENSDQLAIAARCAGKQGLFWAMHDKLFANQGNFDLSSLPNIAVSVGANKKDFSDCLESGDVMIQIQKDAADGQTLGVAGTPTFFVNGYRVAGDIPLDNWEKIINLILNQKQ